MDNIDDAKKEVQKVLDWFLKMCGGETVNTYVVQTDTSERYGKHGGVYIVSENSKTAASKAVDKILSKKKLGCGYNEFVKEVELLNPKKGEILFSRCATFE